MPNAEDKSDWQSVIARSLAFLCLQNSELKNEKIGKKATFLKGLGLSTVDAAAMLGTTPASLYELFRQARNKGGRGARKKAGRK